MKGYLGAGVLLVAAGCAVAQRYDATSFNAQALAAVATHQLEQMRLSPDQRVCLFLPNRHDPDRSLLKQINGHDLHLRVGSACSRHPEGYVLFVNKYQQVDRNNISIKVEVDDMNLGSAHVVTRLREVDYKLRADRKIWKIESSETKNF
jgi:hypothetical protein